MDPAGTLLSIAQLFILIDDFCGAYNEAPRTLNSIRLQMKVLEAAIQRVSEWLQYTDAFSKAQIMGSLQDATATVDSAMQDLRGDLDEIMNTSPKTTKMLGRQGSDSWMKTKYAWNEARLRRHVTDLRECASLMHFTLAVCQLPLGRAADQEIKELGIGARRLTRAHKSTRSARRPTLTQSQGEEPAEQSADFKAFMDAVLSAEEDLPDESPEDTPKSRSRSPEMVPKPLSIAPHSNVTQDTAESTTSERREPVLEPNWRSVKTKSQADELFLPSCDSADFSGKRRAESVPFRDNGIASPGLSLPEVVPGLIASQDVVIEVPPALPPRIPVIDDKASLLPTRPSKQQMIQPLVAATASIPMGPITAADGKFPAVPQSRRPIVRKPIRSDSRPDLPRTISKDESEPGSSRPYEKALMIDGDSMHSQGLSNSNSISVDAGHTFMSSPPAVWSPDSYLAHQTASFDYGETDSPPPYAHSAASINETSPLSLTQNLGASTANWDRRSSLLQRVATDASASIDVDCPPLIRAVKDNREDVVRALATEGIGLEDVEPTTQRTAIIEAARLARKDICRHLIKGGSRLAAKDSESWTALHMAAARGDSVICRLLLDAGAQLEAYDRKGRTPLQIAAEAGQSEAVLCLLNRTPRQGTNDPTLLKSFCETIRLGDVKIAQEFLAHDIKPKKLKDPWQLVACAAQSGNLRMLDFVLEQKVPLKQKSPDGWTALHFATRHGHHAMVEKLLDLKVPWKTQTKKARETALHLAVFHQHTDTALTLIRHKDAHVTIADADGQEPLHHAVRNGSIGLVTELLLGGAKLKTQNHYGWKPIHIAAAYGHTALISLFLTHGADVAAPLHSPSFKPGKKTNEAARKGYYAEIRWPHEDSTALELAIEFGHSDVAKMLLATGAKIEDSDAQRWRPLHYAAYNCRPDLVEILLDRGASPYATTADGQVALELGFREYGTAVTQEDKERVQYLLKAAATHSKKSAFKMTRVYRVGGPESRTARERNQAWHTAEMADALYKHHKAADGEEEEENVYDISSSRSGSGLLELETTTSLPSDVADAAGADDRRVSSLSVHKS